MKSIEVKSPLPALTHLLSQFKRYVGVLFFLLFAGAYAYILVQINTLSNPTIDSSAVFTETQTTAVPRIDSEAIQRLQELKDNSVNVQTLFEQGRTNPFQE